MLTIKDDHVVWNIIITALGAVFLIPKISIHDPFLRF